METISADNLRAVGIEGRRAPREEAHTVADSLVESSLVGLSSVNRTAPPTRDWIREQLDLGNLEFGLLEPRFGEQFRAHQDGAHMFLWLCGKGDRFKRPSGPGSPLPSLEGHNYEPPVGILDDA